MIEISGFYYFEGPVKKMDENVEEWLHRESGPWAVIH